MTIWFDCQDNALSCAVATSRAASVPPCRRSWRRRSPNRLSSTAHSMPPWRRCRIPSRRSGRPHERPLPSSQMLFTRGQVTGAAERVAVSIMASQSKPGFALFG